MAIGADFFGIGPIICFKLRMRRGPIMQTRKVETTIVD